MCAWRPLPWCYAIFNLRLKACLCVDIQLYIVMDKYSFKFLMIKNWSVKEWYFHCKLTALSELFSWWKRIIFMKENIYLREEKYLFTWRKIFIFMKIIRRRWTLLLLYSHLCRLYSCDLKLKRGHICPQYLMSSVFWNLLYK